MTRALEKRREQRVTRLPCLGEREGGNLALTWNLAGQGGGACHIFFVEPSLQEWFQSILAKIQVAYLAMSQGQEAGQVRLRRRLREKEEVGLGPDLLGEHETVHQDHGTCPDNQVHGVESTVLGALLVMSKDFELIAQS